MKKILSSVTLLCLLISSCQKDLSNHLENIQSISSLKSDKEVIELLILNKILVSKMQDKKENTSILLKKTNLAFNEKQQLSTILGFDTIKDCESFFEKQSTLLISIKKRYSYLSKWTKIELQNILIEIENENTNIVKKSLRMSNKCDDRFKNCSKLSNIIYTAEVIGCTTTAIGIGVVTGGWGGVFFQSICGATALEHLQAMRTECQLDYSDCK
jgi:hypothetical protein